MRLMRPLPSHPDPRVRVAGHDCHCRHLHLGEAELLVAAADMRCVLLSLLQARMWQASLARATLAEVGSTGSSTAAEISLLWLHICCVTQCRLPRGSVSCKYSNFSTASTVAKNTCKHA
jgi:hypothetical protein